MMAEPPYDARKVAVVVNCQLTMGARYDGGVLVAGDWELGCKASGYGDTVFDLDHKAKELDGSVNGVFGLHNVRLTQE